MNFHDNNKKNKSKIKEANVNLNKRAILRTDTYNNNKKELINKKKTDKELVDSIENMNSRGNNKKIINEKNTYHNTSGENDAYKNLSAEKKRANKNFIENKEKKKEKNNGIIDVGIKCISINSFKQAKIINSIISKDKDNISDDSNKKKNNDNEKNKNLENKSNGGVGEKQENVIINNNLTNDVNINNIKNVRKNEKNNKNNTGISYTTDNNATNKNIIEDNENIEININKNVIGEKDNINNEKLDAFKEINNINKGEGNFDNENNLLLHNNENYETNGKHKNSNKTESDIRNKENICKNDIEINIKKNISNNKEIIKLEEEKKKEKQNIKKEETTKIKNKNNPQKETNKNSIKLFEGKSNSNEKKSDSKYQYSSITEVNNNNKTNNKSLRLSTNIKNELNSLNSNNNYSYFSENDNIDSKEINSLHTNSNIIHNNNDDTYFYQKNDKHKQKFDIIEIPVNESNKIKPKPILKTNQTVSVISTSNKNAKNKQKLENILQNINEIINKSKAKVEEDLNKIEKNKNLVKGLQRYNTSMEDEFCQLKEKRTLNKSVNKSINKKSFINFSNKKLNKQFDVDLSIKKKENKIYSTDKYKYLNNDNIKNNIKNNSPINPQSPNQKLLIENNESENLKFREERKKTQNKNKYADIDLNNLKVVKTSHKKQITTLENINPNPNIKYFNISDQYEEEIVTKDNNNDFTKSEDDFEKNALISKNKELVKAINELKKEVEKSKNEINFKDEKIKRYLDNFKLISNENAANKAKIENLEEQLFSKDFEVNKKSKQINELLNLNNDLENEMNKMKTFYDNKNFIVKEEYESENLNMPVEKIQNDDFEHYDYEDLQNRRNQLIKNRNELNVLYDKFNNEHEKLKYKEVSVYKNEVEDMLTKINNDLMKIRLKLKNYQ